MPQLPTLTLDASALCTCVPVNTPYRSAEDALKLRRFYGEKTFTALTKDGKCAICDQAFTRASPYLNDSVRVIVLGCGHAFHYSCAKQWGDKCCTCGVPLSNKDIIDLRLPFPTFALCHDYHGAPLDDETIRTAVDNHLAGSPGRWEKRVRSVQTDLLYGPIETWDVSQVTNMDGLFHDAIEFNDDLSRWQVGRVTNMADMFRNAAVFDGDLSRWRVDDVTNMSGMFRDAIAFNGDVSGWDTRNVTDMSDMFWGATAFNQNLSGWDTRKVTNRSDMFLAATSFNRDLSPPTF